MDLSFLDFIPHPLAGTPYGVALNLTILLAAACWLVSVIMRVYSWVDRLWSIVPAIFCLLVAADASFESWRLNLMTTLVCFWGIRLTFNFARKGGYRPGDEDYRWIHTREQIGPIWFQVVNLVFLSAGLMFVLWLIASPMHHAWLSMESPLNWLDGMATALFALFWIGEAVSDHQVWRFQKEKRKRVAEGLEVDAPFITTGLFRFCRHPNFLCELGMWWTFYLFAIAATGELFNWSAFGLISLSAVCFTVRSGSPRPSPYRATLPTANTRRSRPA